MTDDAPFNLGSILAFMCFDLVSYFFLKRLGPDISEKRQVFWLPGGSHSSVAVDETPLLTAPEKVVEVFIAAAQEKTVIADTFKEVRK